ncbi:hypothetical protein J437_LFUL008011 [Ladona fulva]|uniref:HAT C-terminal dimerisation domain-containing protein n=1 Tax=Ladona fulva TaxID=123851 RepID=A0A8K0KEQ6_LADFU|nr:hypothetical protein J437_LFUL008011 [Ladona fulva]
MLQSIMNAMPRLGELLSEINELDLLYNVDCNLLEEMVRILKPFDEATKLLSWGKMPTISLVIPTKMKLKRCLEAKEEDSEIIKKVKWKLSETLDEKFQIDVIHCVGTILHPKMKGFVKQCLGEETFETTKLQIECILNNITGPNSKKDSTSSNDKSNERVREDQSEFLSDVMIDCEAKDSEEDEDELTFYLNSKYSNRFPDPLIYWRQNSSLFPNLFKVAKSVLAIPATSIASERHCSCTGKNLDERKQFLTEDSLNSLLFIQNAMKGASD